MKVLVTGGAGYIGSITCVSLIENGHQPVILDNLSNSTVAAVRAIQTVSGEMPDFHEGDLNDTALVERVLSANGIEAVVHFAGLKAVGESVKRPLAYYRNNVAGTLALVEAMERAGVRNLVFSSSATVYGDPAQIPVRETSPRSATNPYGRTKLIIEYMLEDLAHADPRWSVTLLRYFNPVGAHPSGAMGEDPRGIPNNLMPYIAQVAVGRRDFLPIFGGDYPTPDGTGIRDYIHVVDLANGHVAALDKHSGEPGVHTYNLGTGHGVSVLELLGAFSRAANKNLPSKVVERRPGDIAQIWAATRKAEDKLGWRAKSSIEQMCADTWRWQSTHPNGYSEKSE